MISCHGIDFRHPQTQSYVTNPWFNIDDLFPLLSKLHQTTPTCSVVLAFLPSIIIQAPSIHFSWTWLAKHVHFFMIVYITFHQFRLRWTRHMSAIDLCYRNLIFWTIPRILSSQIHSWQCKSNPIHIFHNISSKNLIIFCTS
jgi:hypothetical protein